MSLQCKNRPIRRKADCTLAEVAVKFADDKNPINRAILPGAFAKKPCFVNEPFWLGGKHGADHVQIKHDRDELLDLDKVNVVVVIYHSQLPCVTFSVSVPGVLLVLELSRIAASGCEYEYATLVALVAAVKFGSLIHVTAELGVIITSSRQYCRVAVTLALAPSTKTAVGMPFIQSKRIGLLVPTDDSVTEIVLANPIALPRSLQTLQT
jgi:hypothetical protein